MRVGPAPDEDEEKSTGVVYVAPGTDGSLALYTEDAFSRLAEQLASIPRQVRTSAPFSRLFYSQAERVEIDRQGRIRIPGTRQIGEVGQGSCPGGCARSLGVVGRRPLGSVSSELGCSV